MFHTTAGPTRPAQRPSSFSRASRSRRRRRRTRPRRRGLTPPKDQFGHAIGDDYFLVNYTQYVDYLKKLDVQSERMVVTEIGKTEEGRPEADGDHHVNLRIRRKLPAHQRGEPQAGAGRWGSPTIRRGALARDAKIVVWIDGRPACDGKYSARSS